MTNDRSKNCRGLCAGRKLSQIQAPSNLVVSLRSQEIKNRALSTLVAVVYSLIANH